MRTVVIRSRSHGWVDVNPFGTGAVRNRSGTSMLAQKDLHDLVCDWIKFVACILKNMAQLLFVARPASNGSGA